MEPPDVFGWTCSPVRYGRNSDDRHPRKSSSITYRFGFCKSRLRMAVVSTKRSIEPVGRVKDH